MSQSYDESFYKPQKSGCHKRARRYFVEEWGIDSLMCFECQAVNEIEIHHINGNPYNNDVDNLQALCHDCHKQLHQMEYVDNE